MTDAQTMLQELREFTEPDESVTHPFRTPPVSEFILFSEKGRATASCLELNGSYGVFLVGGSLRESSLVVVEALTDQGLPCGVRIVCRVSAKSAYQSPLLELEWVRAVSWLPPAGFLEALERFYGFLPPGCGTQLDSVACGHGTEYDFGRHLFAARKPDLTRGDAGRVLSPES